MLSRLKFEIDPLVNEMLDKLPADVWTSDSTTFLDLAIGGGQFVKEIERRLRKAGHSDENIASRVFGFEKDILAIRFATNKYRLVGTYVADKNVLVRDFNGKRFDVVVGNPPYQDSSNSSNKLWTRFSELAITLANSDGFVALVTPSAWTRKPTSQRIKNLTSLFREYQLVYAALAREHFFQVGEKIGYWVLQKARTQAPVLIELSKQKTITLQKYAQQKIASSLEEEMSDQISARLFESSLPKIKSVSYFDMKNDTKLKTMMERGDFSLTRTPKFNAEVFDTPTQTYYMPLNRIRQTYKVIISLTSYYGKPSALDRYNPILGPTVGVGFNSFAIPCSSPAEGERMRSYLFSKLYRFVVSSNKTSNNFIARELPLLDSSRVWTDKEIYRYFNLTQKEIEYIEANV